VGVRARGRGKREDDEKGKGTHATNTGKRKIEFLDARGDSTNLASLVGTRSSFLFTSLGSETSLSQREDTYWDCIRCSVKAIIDDAFSTSTRHRPTTFPHTSLSKDAPIRTTSRVQPGQSHLLFPVPYTDETLSHLQ
jgi:hypothetical protein